MPVSPKSKSDMVPRHGYRGNTAGPRFPRTLTIAVSRQAGARGGTIARQVGQRLGWQVIDHDLVEYMIRQGGTPAGNPQGTCAWIESQLAELKSRSALGPNMDDVARVILGLGATGEVIIV